MNDGMNDDTTVMTVNNGAPRSPRADARHARLTPARLAILEAAASFRVLTIEAVKTLCYAGRSYEAARVALYRLTADGLLSRFEIRNRSYYQITVAGCAAVGAPRNTARPLTTQALVERFAFLCFCTPTGGPLRQRLSERELTDAFPNLLGARGLDPSLQHYFLAEEDDGAVRLTRALVDAGSEAAHVAAKCRTAARDAADGALRDIAAAGAFALVVLTPSEPKRRRIQEALWRDPPAVPVSVVTVERMRDLFP